MAESKMWAKEEEYARGVYVPFMRKECGSFVRTFKDSPMQDITDKTYVRQSLAEMIKEKVPTPRGLEEREVEQQREFREALDRHRKVVVIGRAGRGKTSLLYWAMQEHLKPLERSPMGVVPIYILLKDLRNASSLEDLKTHLSKKIANDTVSTWLWQHVEKQNVLLLLDALDEVPRESHDDRPGRMAFLNKQGILADILRRLSSPQARIVLTCRDAVYGEVANELSQLKSPGEDEGFAKMELKRFNRDQIVAYARLFFQGDEQSVQTFLKDIQDPRGGSNRFTHLAEEPLYLHMLCWLWAGYSDKETTQ